MAIGLVVAQSLRSQIVVGALKMALDKCDSETKIIFHSDRWSKYASQLFLEFLNDKNDKQVIPSRSCKGHCYDNAHVESWFKSLKNEWAYRNQYETQGELRALVFESIETWYNTKRRHSALDYMSPIDYKIKRNSA